MAIALERQNLHGAATAARRVIDIGRPWLRFLGWWRDPADPLLYRDQLDGYATWMVSGVASSRLDSIDEATRQ
jgi:integrase/recombinase XerD